MSHDNLYEGRRIGEYRLLSLLGRGGFGDVYLGEQIHDHSQVAVKLLHARLTSPKEIKEFINEARMSRLQHPHIVQMLDFGVDRDDTPFLVTKYASHGTLRQRYERGTRLSPSLTTYYVSQVALALQYAHDHQVIHRDVKPENMLLSADDRVMLGDFGIASVMHSTQSLTNDKNVGGTASYMAPEQLQGRPCLASDQYALGIVAYEWLSGQRPFRGNHLEVCMQHITTLPPPLSHQVPSLAPEVEQVVFKALAKAPQARFSTIQDFALALQRACYTSHNLHDSHDFHTHPSPITAARLKIPPRLVPLRSSTPSPQSTQSTQPFSPPPLSPPANEMATIQASLTLSSPPQTIHNSGQTLRSRRKAISYILAGGLGVLLTAGAIKLAPNLIGNLPSVTQSSQPPNTPTLYTFRGHHDHVQSVTWFSDNKRIASSSIDHTVQTWDALTGQNILVYAHNARVNEVAISPSNYLASACADHTVHIWDAFTAKEVYIFRQHGDIVDNVAWSPDGSRIASSSANGSVLTWDALTGNNVRSFSRNLLAAHGVSWSPDGRYLAAAFHDNTVRIWNEATGEPLLIYKGHTDAVNSVAWSPDSKFIASAGYDATIHIWNPYPENSASIPSGSSGKTLYVYDHGYGRQDVVWQVAWSPNSDHVVSCSEDATVKIWNFLQKQPTFTYTGHSGGVTDVAWSPDASWIVSCGNDQTAQVWKANQ